MSLLVKDSHNCLASAASSLELLTCAGFTTVTQGGWGAKCAGQNWGCLRDSKFAIAFPGGLIVGSCGRYIKLTSAASLTTLLPCSGTPALLNAGTLVNPNNKTIKNTLVGQVVALTMNVRFDSLFPSFSSSGTNLGNLIINSVGVFQGMTVNQILTEANKALGGCSSYTVGDLNKMCDIINNNYDNGTVNLRALSCPCSPSNLDKTDTEDAHVSGMMEKTNETATIDFTIYPNPTSINPKITLSGPAYSNLKLNVYNSLGQLMTSTKVLVGVDGTALTTIDKSMLSAGIYQVCVLNDNTVCGIHKLICE